MLSLRNGASPIWCWQASVVETVPTKAGLCLGLGPSWAGPRLAVSRGRRSSGDEQSRPRGHGNFVQLWLGSGSEYRASSAEAKAEAKAMAKKDLNKFP